MVEVEAYTFLLTLLRYRPRRPLLLPCMHLAGLSKKIVSAPARTRSGDDVDGSRVDCAHDDDVLKVSDVRKTPWGLGHEGAGNYCSGMCDGEAVAHVQAGDFRPCV